MKTYYAEYKDGEIKINFSSNVDTDFHWQILNNNDDNDD